MSPIYIDQYPQSHTYLDYLLYQEQLRREQELAMYRQEQERRRLMELEYRRRQQEDERRRLMAYYQQKQKEEELLQMYKDQYNRKRKASSKRQYPISTLSPKENKKLLSIDQFLDYIQRKSRALYDDREESVHHTDCYNVHNIVEAEEEHESEVEESSSSSNEYMSDSDSEEESASENEEEESGFDPNEEVSETEEEQVTYDSEDQVMSDNQEESDSVSDVKEYTENPVSNCEEELMSDSDSGPEEQDYNSNTEDEHMTETEEEEEESYLDEDKKLKLKLLNEIQKELEHIREEKEEAILGQHLDFSDDDRVIATTRGNKEFLGYEDEILKMILKLDNIESKGDEDIRKERKRLIQIAERMLQILDEFKQKEWEKHHTSEEELDF